MTIRTSVTSSNASRPIAATRSGHEGDSRRRRGAVRRRACAGRPPCAAAAAVRRRGRVALAVLRALASSLVAPPVIEPTQSLTFSARPRRGSGCGGALRGPLGGAARRGRARRRRLAVGRSRRRGGMRAARSALLEPLGGRVELGAQLGPLALDGLELGPQASDVRAERRLPSASARRAARARPRPPRARVAARRTEVLGTPTQPLLRGRGARSRLLARAAGAARRSALEGVGLARPLRWRGARRPRPARAGARVHSARRPSASSARRARDASASSAAPGGSSAARRVRGPELVALRRALGSASRAPPSASARADVERGEHPLRPPRGRGRRPCPRAWWRGSAPAGAAPRALERRGRGRSTTMPRPTSSSAPASLRQSRRPRRTPPIHCSGEPASSGSARRRRRPAVDLDHERRARAAGGGRRASVPSTSSRSGSTHSKRASSKEMLALVARPSAHRGRTAGPSVVVGSRAGVDRRHVAAGVAALDGQRERHAAEREHGADAHASTAPSASHAPVMRVAGRRRAAGRGSARRRSRPAPPRSAAAGGARSRRRRAANGADGGHDRREGEREHQQVEDLEGLPRGHVRARTSRGTRSPAGSAPPGPRARGRLRFDASSVSRIVDVRDHGTARAVRQCRASGSTKCRRSATCVTSKMRWTTAEPRMSVSSCDASWPPRRARARAAGRSSRGSARPRRSSTSLAKPASRRRSTSARSLSTVAMSSSPTGATRTESRSGSTSMRKGSNSPVSGIRFVASGHRRGHGGRGAPRAVPPATSPRSSGPGGWSPPGTSYGCTAFPTPCQSAGLAGAESSERRRTEARTRRACRRGGPRPSASRAARRGRARSRRRAGRARAGATIAVAAGVADLDADDAVVERRLQPRRGRRRNLPWRSALVISSVTSRRTSSSTLAPRREREALGDLRARRGRRRSAPGE